MFGYASITSNIHKLLPDQKREQRASSTARVFALCPRYNVVIIPQTFKVSQTDFKPCFAILLIKRSVPGFLLLQQSQVSLLPEKAGLSHSPAFSLGANRQYFWSSFLPNLRPIFNGE